MKPDCRAANRAGKKTRLGRVWERKAHLRHMEPEHLCLSPRGPRSEPQRNGRHAPAPPKSPRLGTFYFEHRCSGYPRAKEPSGDLWGEEPPPVVARLHLAITRSVRFGHLDGRA